MIARSIIVVTVPVGAMGDGRWGELADFDFDFETLTLTLTLTLALFGGPAGPTLERLLEHCGLRIAVVLR